MGTSAQKAFLDAAGFSDDGCPVEILWWTLTIALMAIGLVGTVVPLLPGVVLILAGAALNFFLLGSIGWGTLLVLTALAVLAMALDFVSGAAGAKYFGASRWGAVGGILGAIVGLFFGVIGIFVGPLVGAVLGEILGGRGILPAGRSGWGTFLGTAAGMIGKLALGTVMVAWFAVAVLA